MVFGVVVLGAGSWWYFGMQSGSVLSSTTFSSDQNEAAVQNATRTQAAQNASVSQGGGNTNVSATNTSDAALQQDLANIDAQMGGLKSDSTSANSAIESQ